MNPIRLAILTVSDSVARGTRLDRSGDLIANWAETRAYTTIARAAVGDEIADITETIQGWTERDPPPDLVITTGGTGFTNRDLTPEATRALIEREAPGVAEAIRQEGAAKTPYTWLSRGVAGIRGQTLIVNLPGSTGGVRDGLAVLGRIAGHATQLLRGIDTDRHQPEI